MMHKICHVDCRDEANAHLLPVEPLDVQIGESETLLPAGTVSSILEGTIVVQVPRLTPPSYLAVQLCDACMCCMHVISIYTFILSGTVLSECSAAATQMCIDGPWK